MAGEKDLSPILKLQLNQTLVKWQQDNRSHSQVYALQEKLKEVTACVKGSEENSKKELDVLWRRVKTSATLLTYLKSKAQIMAVPDLAHTSCGIRYLDGIGIVDKNGVPLSSWMTNVEISSLDSGAENKWTALGGHDGLLDEHDGVYTSELLKSVQMVTDVMETLVKRVIMAESETAIQREMVTVGHEEIKKKVVQIENMSIKLEEMEEFATGTNCILNEMRQRVEDLVDETSRQRQRAAENEQELSRVKSDFESLKAYVSTLISVRETLVSSEKQFQTIERHFEREELDE
ncbi:hypothetical protein OROGR_021316 [Orobanche gracilis]